MEFYIFFHPPDRVAKGGGFDYNSTDLTDGGGAPVSDQEHTHDHAYLHEHGIPHEHHGHTHSPEHIKRVSNRLARAIGHLESVKKMVEDGRDCSEVLIQLAAVRSALTNTGKVILKDHMDHCIVDAVEHNDLQAIEELNKAIEQLIK